MSRLCISHLSSNFSPYTYWPLRASVKMTDTLLDVMECTECNCRPNAGEEPRLSNILRLYSESFRHDAEIMLFSLSSKHFVSCIWLHLLKMWWLGITAIFPQVSQYFFTMGKWWCTNNVMPATPPYTQIIFHHWHVAFSTWKSVWCLERCSMLYSVAFRAILYVVVYCMYNIVYSLQRNGTNNNKQLIFQGSLTNLILFVGRSPRDHLIQYPSLSCFTYFYKLPISKSHFH